MKIKEYQELPIWKLSLKMTKVIYDLTYKEKFNKDFCLRDQIRRAVISISSNIVEGFEKNNNNELIRYLKISKGSVGEVENQLYIALSIKYVNQNEFDYVYTDLTNLSKQIGGLINYLSLKRKNKEFLIR